MPGPAKQFDYDDTLAKAGEVFRERGFAGATTTELQRRMGLGRKSLYDTYGNKRSLVGLAAAAYAKTVVAELRAQLAAPSGTPLENLRASLLSWADLQACEGYAGCLLGNCAADLSTADAADAETVAIVTQGYTQVAAAFAEAVAAAQDAGEVGAHVNPEAAGRALLSVTQGMSLVGRLSPDAQLAAATVEIAIAGLR